MLLHEVKTHFAQLIEDQNNSVVALTGAWGIGKSHMWRELRKEKSKGDRHFAPDKQFKDALYVSLFGIKSVEELKSKIVQSRISDTKYTKAIKDSVGTIEKGVSALAKRFIPGMATVNIEAMTDFVPMVIPFLIQGKLIVIDDIERKHKDLQIDELLGFIDEFKEIYKSRFVLILNSDKLGEDKEDWETLREKIIDHEVAMNIESSEVFDLAVKSMPSKFEEAIRAASVECGVKNIRIIHKIIRTANALLAHRDDLSFAALRRTIPPLVLFSTLHYKGMAGAPDLASLVEDRVRQSEDLAARFKGGAPRSLDEKAKDSVRGSMLMSKLRIERFEEYEMFIFDYLNSGFFDKRAMDLILDKFVKDGRPMDAESKLRDFLERQEWSVEHSNEQLLSEASGMAGDAVWLDEHDISLLHGRVAKIPGGEAIAQKLIVDWLAKCDEEARPLRRAVRRRKLHPEIERRILERREEPVPRQTLFELSKKFDESGHWEEKDKLEFNAAAVADFEAELKRLRGNDFRFFVERNIAYHAVPEKWAKCIEQAMGSFLVACREIQAEEPSSRLSDVIELAFEEVEMAELLRPGVQPSGPPAA